jgi:hypothetical protein
MRRLVRLPAVVLLAASTGCGDSLVGPVRSSYTSSLTFAEPTTEPATCCPTDATPCACGQTSCAGNCSSSSCCPASHCDENGRHK